MVVVENVLHKDDSIKIILGGSRNVELLHFPKTAKSLVQYTRCHSTWPFVATHQTIAFFKLTRDFFDLALSSLKCSSEVEVRKVYSHSSIDLQHTVNTINCTSTTTGRIRTSWYINRYCRKEHVTIPISWFPRFTIRVVLLFSFFFLTFFEVQNLTKEGQVGEKLTDDCDCEMRIVARSQKSHN